MDDDLPVAGAATWWLDPLDLDWQDDARCRGRAPSGDGRDIFFPRRGEGFSEALWFCRGCPVVEQCADYAIRHGIEHGVWGGLLPSQRKRLAERQPA